MPKKLLKQLYRFALQNTCSNHKFVIEPKIVTHIVKRPHRASFGVMSCVNATINARVKHEARAHKARLKRNVHRAAKKSPALERFSRVLHCQKLSVTCRISAFLARVVRAGDDCAVMNNNRADGHLVFRGCGARLG